MTIIMPDLYEDMQRKLREITEDFITKGYFLSTEHDQSSAEYVHWRNRVLLHDTNMRKYLRMIARQMKRPFVWGYVSKYPQHRFVDGKTVPTGNWVESYSLNIPNQKRLAVLHTALQLVGADSSRRWGAGEEKLPVRYWGRSMLNYQIKDPVHFHKWIERAEHDPEFRKALKLPER